MPERNRQLPRRNNIFLFILIINRKQILESPSAPSEPKMVSMRRIVESRALPDPRPEIIAIFEEVLLREEVDVVDLGALGTAHFAEVLEG